MYMYDVCVFYSGKTNISEVYEFKWGPQKRGTMAHISDALNITQDFVIRLKLHET